MSTAEDSRHSHHYISIPRVPPIHSSEFYEKYFNNDVPVIIESILENSFAKDWTLSSLKKDVGKRSVQVRWNTNSHSYRIGLKYDIRTTLFENYIDDIIKENSRSKNSYLAVQNIQKTFPELSEDFKIPEYVGKMHGGPYLWIAPKNHYEYCHFDPDDGFLVIVNGKKQAYLFKSQIESLYPNPLGSKGRTIQSSVNCHNPDFSIHPKFSSCICHEAILNSGDMLYIPALWWHQITSLETTISINMFWGNSGKNQFIERLMKPNKWDAFKYWLLNIVEQNRHYPSFPRTLSRIREALANFLMNQWHEEASAEQLDKLILVVMDFLQISELPNELSSGKHPPPLQIRGLLWRSDKSSKTEPS